jgi:hypothetical protein
MSEATALKSRNILWPTQPKPDPNGVQRLARVLHWCFAAGAVAFVVGAIVNSGPDRTGCLAVAVGFALFGRALRYVMAGE